MLQPFRRSSIRFLFVLFFHEVLNRAGGQCMPDSHCPTKTLSVHGDMEKRRLFHVPAIQVELLEKLLSFVVSCISECHMSVEFPSSSRYNSRPVFDKFSTKFPSFSTRFRSDFKPFSIILGTIFDQFSNQFRPNFEPFSTSFRPIFDYFPITLIDLELYIDEP